MRTKSGRAVAGAAALNALVEHVPSMLADQGYKPDACILATRVACLALTEVGIRATPLACKVDVLNPVYVKAISDGWQGQPWDGQDPLNQKHRDWLLASGAWAITIGDPRNEDIPRPDGRRGFNAHLLCLVGRRYVVDLTLPQANRPAKDIVLRPDWFEIKDGSFLRGEDSAVFFENGCALRYMVVDRKDFLTAPDWTMLNRHNPLVRSTVAALR